MSLSGGVSESGIVVEARGKLTMNGVSFVEYVSDLCDMDVM